MQTTSVSFWFRIVSIRIAVFPVERSPMISSRWPRPMFVIESIALMPVWSGSFTGWRATTPGALNSSGRRSSASIAPRPSIGLPSGSTTRPSRARLQDDPADELRVDAARRVDLAACRLLDLAHDRICFRVGQVPGRDQLHVETALFACDQALELLRHLLELAGPVLLGNEKQEVLEQRLVVSGEVGEDLRLRRRFELRIAQHGPQLRRCFDRGREVGERLVDLCEAIVLLGCREQRLGVDAVRGGYLESSSREKSSEPIASVIS